MADDWTAPAQRANGEVVTHTIWNEQVMDNLTALKAASEGDAQATGEVLHYHKVGTLAAKPAPGNAGRTYLASDIGLWLLDDGTSWHPDHHILTLCEHWEDDLIAWANDTPETINWGEATDGTGTVSIVSGATSRVQLSTGATSGSNVWLRPRIDSENFFQVTADRLPALMVFQWDAIDDLANGTNFGGIIDTFPAGNVNPVNGLYIRKTGAGNLFAVSRKADAETATDLGVDGTSSPIIFIEVLATDVVKFYLNTYDAAADATHDDTTMPIVNTDIGFKVVNNAASDRRFDVEFTSWYAKR